MLRRFDSHWWCLQTDLVVLLALGFGRFGDAVPTLRRQLAVFYLASAFWKLNTSFLDPASSCAGVFGAQVLAYYAGPAGPALAPALARAAPALTILVEFAIGLAMLFEGRAAVPLAVGFHFAIGAQFGAARTRGR